MVLLIIGLLIALIASVVFVKHKELKWVLVGVISIMITLIAHYCASVMVDKVEFLEDSIVYILDCEDSDTVCADNFINLIDHYIYKYK